MKPKLLPFQTTISSITKSPKPLKRNTLNTSYRENNLLYKYYMEDIIKKITTTLVVAGISWMVYTTVEIKSEMKLMNYKLEANNYVLQDIYESKKDN